MNASQKRIMMKEALGDLSKHQLVQKLFNEHDKDNSQTISKFEFPDLLRGLFLILGNQCPTNEDVEDIFYQLDINGDQNISKVELMALVDKLFAIIDDSEVIHKLEDEE